MNSISFLVQPSKYFAEENQHVLEVVPVVDGVLFDELATEFESEKEFEGAGGYAGRFCSDDSYENFLSFYLGTPTEEYYQNLDRLPLFSCDGCGGEACNSLEARIGSTEHDVVWSDFGHQHAPDRDYSELGPFRFNRTEYVNALKAAFSELPPISDRKSWVRRLLRRGRT